MCFLTVLFEVPIPKRQKSHYPPLSFLAWKSFKIFPVEIRSMIFRPYAEYDLLFIQILKRPKCSVPPHPLGVSTLLHEGWHMDMMAGGYRSHEHAVMHLF